MTKHAQVLYIGNTDENADWIKTEDSLDVAVEVYTRAAEPVEEQPSDDQPE